MNNRVEQAVFWPGISVDIINSRHTCGTCIRESPSQPAGVPVEPPSPEYPFQMVVGDYFSLQGYNYLVLGDRFSGWLSIYGAGTGEFDGKTLEKILREHFMTFNIPEEFATDGGPQMMSNVVQNCLLRWGVKHRLSSAYFPHSNSRAELAVKTGKRLLRDNMAVRGSLHNDKIMRAVMQYRNTPLPDLRLSPAQIVFNRQLRDFLPVLPYKYRPSQEWSLLQEDRERALASRRAMDGSRLAQYTKQQPELPVGTAVAVQNQTGRNPTKWDKTGVILENKPHSQVLIKMDGSRRATLRNRKFVKQILPQEMRPEMLPRSCLKAKQQTRQNETNSLDIAHPNSQPQPAQSPGMQVPPEAVSGGGLVIKPLSECPSSGTFTDLLEFCVPTVLDTDDNPPPEITSASSSQQLPATSSPSSPPPSPSSSQPPTPTTSPTSPPPKSERPRRSTRPNPKYDPQVYDLDMVSFSDKI